MNSNFRHTAIVVALILLFTAPAFAGGYDGKDEHDKCKTKTCAPAPAPIPAPAPQPIIAPPAPVIVAPAPQGPVTASPAANGTGQADADADAAAKALSAALAKGGDADANAKAVNDIVVGLESNPSLKAEVMNRLTNEQRTQVANAQRQAQQQSQRISDVGNGTANASSSGGNASGGNGTGGAATAGGAVVSTHSTVKSITLTGMTASAPALPYQSGQFTVVDGECAPRYTYEEFKVTLLHRRSFLPDRAEVVNTGLLTMQMSTTRPNWEVLGEELSKDGTKGWRIVQGEIPRQLAGHQSLSTTSGATIQIGGSGGAGGVGTSGGNANQFMAAYYLAPKTCYMKQVKVGIGWVPESLVGIEVAPPSLGPSQALDQEGLKRDIVAAVREALMATMTAKIEYPTATVERTVGTCKLMEFRDEKGQTFKACPGSRSGNTATTKVIPGKGEARVTIGATANAGGATDSK